MRSIRVSNKQFRKLMQHGHYLVAAAFVAVAIGATANHVAMAANQAEYQWKEIQPGDNIRDIQVVDNGRRLIALQGDKGSDGAKLLVSDDQGGSWRTLPVPDGATGLYADDSGAKLAVRIGYRTGSFLYMSSNGGKDWIEQRPALLDGADFDMSGDGKLMTLCRDNVLHISFDDGATWKEQGSHCPSEVLNNGAMTAWIGNGLSISTDYGKTWRDVSGGFGNRVGVSRNGTNMVRRKDRLHGIFEVSKDAGMTWEEAPTKLRYAPSGGDISSLFISDDAKNIVVMTGPVSSYPVGDYVYVSADGGVTWAANKELAIWSGTMSPDGGVILTSGYLPFSSSLYQLATLVKPQTDTVEPPQSNAAQGGDLTVARLTTNSLYCSTIDRQSLTNLSPEGVTAPESRVRIVGGIAFNLSCAKPATSSDISLHLSRKVDDIAGLRVYKRRGQSTSLEDITQKVTVKHETVDGREIATISYRAVDGADYDEDGTVNGVIVDPIYVGVVSAGGAASQDGVSAPAASGEGTSQNKTTTPQAILADTGAPVIALLLGASALLTGGIVLLYRTKR